jgi:hypothetical protein
VQNSEGTDWPPPGGNGQIWFSYDAFIKTQSLAATAYPHDPSPPTGTMLQGRAGAPAGSITRAFQWSTGQQTYVVLIHHFADPILVQTIALTSPSGRTLTSPVNQFIQAGYTHFHRDDGKSFATGAWKVTITGEDAKGAQVTYTGTVQLGAPAPVAHPAAAMGPGIVGPTNAAATITEHP